MRLLVVLLGACGFTQTVTETAIDAPEVDAAPDAMPDAMIDAPVVLLPPCNIGVMAKPGTDRGVVGNEIGGGANTPLTCSGTNMIVGIAARISNGNTLYNDRSAHGFTIACAAVSVDPNTGMGTTGTVTLLERMGSGAEGWSPSTQSAVAMCPPGHVVNGLRAHSGPNNTLFANVSFRCAKLDGTAVTVGNPVVSVTGTTAQTAGSETINCAANELVTQFGTRTGSGFDAAIVFCSPARCL